MESIVSISNWSYFFINIIEIHFLSFFWERKFYGVMMKSAFISFCSQNLILIYFFFFDLTRILQKKIREFLSLKMLTNIKVLRF